MLRLVVEEARTPGQPVVVQPKQDDVADRDRRRSGREKARPVAGSDEGAPRSGPQPGATEPGEQQSGGRGERGQIDGSPQPVGSRQWRAPTSDQMMVLTL